MSVVQLSGLGFGCDWRCFLGVLGYACSLSVVGRHCVAALCAAQEGT